MTPTPLPNYVRVEASGAAAAVLHIAGASGVGAVDLPLWGIAIDSALTIDRDDRLHAGACPHSVDTRPVKHQDLTVIDCRRTCTHRSCSAPLTAAETSPFLNSLTDLSWELTRSRAIYRHGAEDSVFRDRRTLAVAEDSAAALRRFRETCVLPARLLGAVAESEQWFTVTATAALQRLRADGLSRLTAHMSGNLTARPAAEDATTAAEAIALAESTLPGRDSEHLVCMYQWIDPYLDVALTSLSNAAIIRFDDEGEPCHFAVASLPRPLAVLLHAAATQWLPGALPALAYAESVGELPAGPKPICLAAARMWAADPGANPGRIWRAVRAASA